MDYERLIQHIDEGSEEALEELQRTLQRKGFQGRFFKMLNREVHHIRSSSERRRTHPNVDRDLLNQWLKWFDTECVVTTKPKKHRFETLPRGADPTTETKAAFLSILSKRGYKIEILVRDNISGLFRIKVAKYQDWETSPTIIGFFVHYEWV